jgi:hypothetical protein
VDPGLDATPDPGALHTAVRAHQEPQAGQEVTEADTECEPDANADADPDVERVTHSHTDPDAERVVHADGDADTDGISHANRVTESDRVVQPDRLVQPDRVAELDRVGQSLGGWTTLHQRDPGQHEYAADHLDQ